MNIKRALISVSNKKDLDILVKKLIEKNIEIIATGNTAKFINDLLNAQSAGLLLHFFNCCRFP